MSEAYAALAPHGDAAIDAVLEVLREGCPDDRHRNDWHADLTGAFMHVADVDPWPLVERIRASALGDMMFALTHCRHPDAPAALAALLDHERRQIRDAAVVALGRRKDPRALEPLVAMLGRRRVDFSALEAAAGYDDPRLVAPLEAILARPQTAGVERVAREILARHRGAPIN
jgi:HEAT repeat protein